MEREYPTILLNEIDLTRAGLVAGKEIEAIPPADLVISGSMDDVSRVYEPDKPWEVTLDLSLRLRGNANQVSQTFRSDAIEAAADKIMQKIEEVRRQPVAEAAVPEKELWRRQALYLTPKPYDASRVGLNPSFPWLRESNRLELIRTWENVLLLDNNDAEAMIYLGACLIGIEPGWSHHDKERWTAQWIAASRLVERTVSIQPTLDHAASFCLFLRAFVSHNIAPQRHQEMARYTVDHPEQFKELAQYAHDHPKEMVSESSTNWIKIALTRAMPAADGDKFAKLAAALDNAEKDPDAVLILFSPELTRDGPTSQYAGLLTPYLDSPNPVVQFVVQRAMGVLLCWAEKDPAALAHFDKAIAAKEAAYQRSKWPYRQSLDDIYRLRIEACQYLSLPEEAKKTAWAGAAAFQKNWPFRLWRSFLLSDRMAVRGTA